MNERTLKATIICGSQRSGSQSAKVGRFLQTLLSRNPAVETFLFDLGQSPMRLWTDDPNEEEELMRTWLPISEALRSSEALVFVTPEWNGMVPPAFKNFFLYCRDHEIADKPALIVAVSSGRGGSTPAAELRMSSYKDTHVCYIPEQVIVNYVGSVLNSVDQPESEGDAYIRFRLSYGLDILLEYGKALALVRQSKVRNFEQIPYGM